jgi:glycine dehydrogenase subunit 2
MLVFDKSVKGRRAVDLPKCDVPVREIPTNDKRQKHAGLAELSEMEVVRHYTNLSRKNIGIDNVFYPLGSCTMKYNPRLNEKVAALKGFTQLHPLLPQLRNGDVLSQGALEVIYDTEQFMCDLLGFAGFTMQPLAGAHGELTGIMIISAYHASRNDDKRKVMLIPDSAHGTNPASAALAGLVCKEIPTDAKGDIDLAALEETLDDTVAGLMLTAPSTQGIFDNNTKKVCDMIHEAGGLVYLDGANLNAIMGQVRPGDLGFDVLHSNLHKTFSTPHGGGGPGAGPVGVCEKLLPFLPDSRVVKKEDGGFTLTYNNPQSIGYIAPFYGNFLVVLRAYAYMLRLGREGVKKVSENAVISANYIRARLKPYYDEAVERFCMHECVFSANRQVDNGVHALDIAKALLDRGFHPPTIYFPLIVPEAMMIEPTETESKQDIDRFCDAMIEIAKLAESNPEKVTATPLTTPVSRLDEAQAARKPNVADID